MKVKRRAGGRRKKRGEGKRVKRGDKGGREVANRIITQMIRRNKKKKEEEEEEERGAGTEVHGPVLNLVRYVHVYIYIYMWVWVCELAPRAAMPYMNFLTLSFLSVVTAVFSTLNHQP